MATSESAIEQVEQPEQAGGERDHDAKSRLATLAVTGMLAGGMTWPVGCDFNLKQREPEQQPAGR